MNAGPAGGGRRPMRNSKVRQRIAAGKLKLRIRDLRNLGARSEQVLGAIGIRTADELRRQGAVRTYAELKRAGSRPSLNMLWALAGAAGAAGALRARAGRGATRCAGGAGAAWGGEVPGRFGGVGRRVLGVTC